MANISKIKLPNNEIYNIVDEVTSVGIANTGGLTISGSPVTGSGTISIGHSNSVTAQTTQAVYPIKIDAQGHISEYGSAVTIPTVPTNVSAFTNDAGYITASHTSTYSLPLAANGTRGGVQIGYSESGTNYAVKLSSEKMYVTVPWTDTQISVANLPTNNTRHLIAQASNTTPGTTTGYSSSEFTIGTDGSTTSTLTIGNNYKGQIQLGYIKNSSLLYTTIVPSHTTSRTITLPDKTGTVALTSDIPTISYPVTSVNGETGAVTLTGYDIETDGVQPSGVDDNVSAVLEDIYATIDNLPYTLRAKYLTLDDDGYAYLPGPTDEDTYPLTGNASSIRANFFGALLNYIKGINTELVNLESALESGILPNKQDLLVSGTNIKTINNQSLLGSGNLSIGGITSVGIANSANGGLTVSGSPITTSGTIYVGHTNSITAGSIGSSTPTDGNTIEIPYATYDNNGHITGTGVNSYPVARYGGNVREVTVYSSESAVSSQIQMKHTVGDMLAFSINSTGTLSLERVPQTSTGEDDWSNATTVWSQDMTDTIPTKLSDVTNDKLASSLFVVETGDAIAVSTSTSGAVASKPYTKTGYTLIGVVGYRIENHSGSSGVTQANLYRLYRSNNTVYAGVRTAATATMDVYPQLLWLKTS